MTQRIEPSFERCDSKNWTFFQMWLKESNLLFFQYDSTNWTFFFCMWFMFSNDLKIFWEKFLKELIFHMTQRMVPDAETWNLCFWNLIQRIGLFFFWWLADLIFFSKLWRKDFLKNMTQRIGPFLFWKNDSKNWTFLYDSKNRTHFLMWLFSKKSKIELFSKKWPKELNFAWLGLTELDPFLEYDSENWNFFLVFLHVSKNWTFFKNDAENWTLFSLNMTQRIEPFFLWIRRKEFEFFYMTQKIEPFSDMTQRIEPSLNVTQRVEFFERD